MMIGKKSIGISRNKRGKPPRWVNKTPKRLTAGDIARQRIEDLVSETLKDTLDDTTIWEFYTFLYKKAKEHKHDYSGFASIEYQIDRETSRSIKNSRS